MDGGGQHPLGWDCHCHCHLGHCHCHWHAIKCGGGWHLLGWGHRHCRWVTLRLGSLWPLLLLVCDRGWWWPAPTWLGSSLSLSLGDTWAGVVVAWGGWHCCCCCVIDGGGGWHPLGWGHCHCCWAGVVNGHIIGRCNAGLGVNSGGGGVCWW